MGRNNLPALAHARVFAAYLELGTLKLAAAHTGHNIDTVKEWSVKERWPERRDLIRLRALDMVADVATNLIATERAPTMRRHLGMSKRLMTEVDAILDGSSKRLPKDLADLSRTVKAAADVAAQVIGIDRKDQPAGDMAGKSWGYLPATPKTIDAEFEEEARAQLGGSEGSDQTQEMPQEGQDGTKDASEPPPEGEDTPPGPQALILPAEGNPAGA